MSANANIYQGATGIESNAIHINEAKSTASARLNPKLTARRQVRPDPPLMMPADIPEEVEEELSSDESDFDPDTYETPRSDVTPAQTTSSKVKKTNNSRNTPASIDILQKLGNSRLKHDGIFIQKVFKVGRAIPLTGIWNCCGNTTPLSLYCDSKEARAAIKLAFAASSRTQEELRAYRDAKLAGPKAQWDSLKGTSGLVEDVQSAEDIAMESAAKTDSNFNAPMLSSWLYKNVHEEPTVISGMAFLQQHLESAEGCELMLKHEIVGAIDKIHNFYKEHPPLQLQCGMALRQLLDCNYPRGRIVANTTALRIAFKIAHVHMNSNSHVQQAMCCISQCARSEVCRTHILRTRMYAYVVHWCKRFNNSGAILKPALRFFNWVATDNARIVELCTKGEVVPVILRVMKKNMSNSGVLGSGMLFLTRASACHPAAMSTILRMKATPMVIRALSALYADENLQLEGLKMIQTISKTAEGWRQITETKGGWQSITQGTDIGNALVHDLPGLLHNPGWAIGDTPHLPLADQQRIKATTILQNIGKGIAPTVSWTAHGLRDYMGISMKETKLAFNTEYVAWMPYICMHRLCFSYFSVSTVLRINCLRLSLIGKICALVSSLTLTLILYPHLHIDNTIHISNCFPHWNFCPSLVRSASAGSCASKTTSRPRMCCWMTWSRLCWT